MTKKIFENYFKQNLNEKAPSEYDDKLLDYFISMGISPEEAEQLAAAKDGEGKFTAPGPYDNFGQDYKDAVFDMEYPDRKDIFDDEQDKIIKKIVEGDEYYKKLSRRDKTTIKVAKEKKMQLYIVRYGQMAMNPKLDYKRPVLLTRQAAYTFYNFLKRWPYELKDITLSTQTRHPGVDLTVKGEKGATSRSLTSAHRHGTAVDIGIPGKVGSQQHTDYRESIFNIAYEVGFRAFGFGPTVMHIDLRNRHTWWRYPEGSKDISFAKTTAGHHTMDLLPHDAEGFEEFLEKCRIGKKAMNKYRDELEKWRARKNVSGDIKSALPEDIAPGTNKILKEYILSNTPQQPKEVSVIEIIADEVNEVLNNLPEVQLASEVLSEDELKDLFSPLAKQVVTKVRGQIEEEIKKLVEVTVSDELFQKMAAFLPDDPTAIPNLTDEERDELARAGLQFAKSLEEQED